MATQNGSAIFSGQGALATTYVVEENAGGPITLAGAGAMIAPAPPIVDFQPIANGVDALVESQAQYLSDVTSGPLSVGYLNGIAQPEQFNKTLRQASMISAAIANMIAQVLGTNVFDDGNLTTLTTKLTSALDQIIAGAAAVEPSGTVVDFLGTTVPSGWVEANGQALSRTTNAALFTAIGTVWGAGDGSTTFNVPNLNGLVTVGRNGSFTFGNALGDMGGEYSHMVTIDELPGHGHGISDPGHVHSVSDPGHGHGISDPGHAHSVFSTGGTAGPQQGGGGGINEGSPATGLGTSNNASGIGIFAAATGLSLAASFTNITLSNAGSNALHNNVQPIMVSLKLIKL